MKRILVLSCDAKFFTHAQDLVSSVRATSAGVVDDILFFDLGIHAEQRSDLAAMGVRILTYPQSLTDGNTYPGIFCMPRASLPGRPTRYRSRSGPWRPDLLYCD